MPSLPPPDLRRGDWLRRNHTSAGYVSSQAFRTISPRWVFGSDGPLAAWCTQYPRGADERARDVYQFGVYTGGTMAGVVLYLRDLRVRFGTLWGFDSFVGLPAEAPGMNLVTPNWRPGAYSAADALGRWRWSRLEWEVLHKISRPASEGNVSLIRGFFNATLTPTLAAERRMSPALYVDVDADLYLSTTQALDWLFCSGLMVGDERTGTLVRYDDWPPDVRAGEKRAHRELTVRHSVVWSLPALLPNWFRVVSYVRDSRHCAARGYPPPPPPPPPPPLPPSGDFASDLLRCVDRVDMWRRPFVSRRGIRLRCSHKYLRKMRANYAWALSHMAPGPQPDGTTAPAASQGAQPVSLPGRRRRDAPLEWPPFCKIILANLTQPNGPVRGLT